MSVIPPWVILIVPEEGDVLQMSLTHTSLHVYTRTRNHRQDARHGSEEITEITQEGLTMTNQHNYFSEVRVCARNNHIISYDRVRTQFTRRRSLYRDPDRCELVILIWEMLTVISGYI